MGRGANRKNRRAEDRATRGEPQRVKGLTGFLNNVYKKNNEMNGRGTPPGIHLVGDMARAEQQAAMQMQAIQDRAMVMRTTLAGNVMANLTSRMDSDSDIEANLEKAFKVADLVIGNGMGIAFHPVTKDAAKEEVKEEPTDGGIVAE